MEQQIKARENQSEGATNAVKNLEMHHVAGLTDLRGRVARYCRGLFRSKSQARMIGKLLHVTDQTI